MHLLPENGLLDTLPPLQVRPDGHIALAKMDTSPSVINYFIYIKCLMLNVISINLLSPQYFSAYLTYANMSVKSSGTARTDHLIT